MIHRNTRLKIEKKGWKMTFGVWSFFWAGVKEVRSRRIGAVAAESRDKGVLSKEEFGHQSFGNKHPFTTTNDYPTSSWDDTQSGRTSGPEYIECNIIGERRDRPSVLSYNNSRTQRESWSWWSRYQQERQSVMLQGALAADYECKMNHLIHLDSLLSYNDIQAATNKYKLT